MNRLAILTPIDHIDGLLDLLSANFNCLYRPNDSFRSIAKELIDVDLIFTNPNSSQFRLDEEFFLNCSSVKAVFTASTGTNHIDLEFAEKRSIEVYSLKEEYDLINQLSSTAELAFAFALISTRNLLPAIESVKEGDWDYRPFVGRQFAKLSIGIIGFGRLGKMFANYCTAFNAKVRIFDPYVKKVAPFEFVNELSDLLKKSDIISLHVHHTEETEGLVDTEFLLDCKPSVTLINTSRGEIVNEADLLRFLRANPGARYCTDVLANEILGRAHNPILKYLESSSQVVVTPHIGGMTSDGQMQAFFFMANRLIQIYGKGGRT
jgi:phosphoglycerate dehydrogenase-like enzyme